MIQAVDAPPYGQVCQKARRISGETIPGSCKARIEAGVPKERARMSGAQE